MSLIKLLRKTKKKRLALRAIAETNSDGVTKVRPEDLLKDAEFKKKAEELRQLADKLFESNSTEER